MSMTSIYCGPSNIHHISVKVIAPDGSLLKHPPPKIAMKQLTWGKR